MGEGLFPSEITECLNAELSSGPAFDKSEVIKDLQALYEQVVQLGDGRWTLKRRLS
jgi:2-hydroxy-3-keto-5-methylthiopentenyl-1-phosphate phosphatase